MSLQSLSLKRVMQQGEDLRREAVEIFLLLPPKVYLPLIFRS